MTRLAKIVRWRLAVTFVIAYVVCVLVPPIAHAFSGNWAAAHLTAGHHHYGSSNHAQAANASVHSSGAVHDHATHGHASHDDPISADVDGQDGCCTYFCVSAAPVAMMPDLAPALGFAKTLTAANTGIAGRGPGRIDRPPIVLLPL